MFANDEQRGDARGDYEPLFWVGTTPVYAATFLTGLHVAALLALLLLSMRAFGGAGAAIAEAFTFSNEAVWQHGALWQWGSYPWVHPGGTVMDLLGFAIEMVLLWMFGREVERYVGRWKFLFLYALLALIPAWTLTLLGLWMPGGLRGSGGMELGVFLTFAFLYPRVEMFFRMQARFLAMGLVAICALAALGQEAWDRLAALAATVWCAWGFIRWLRGEGIFAWKMRKPRLRVVRAAAKSPNAVPARDPMEEIDPLLEKISQTGLASLTPKERETMERAREQLLRQNH